MDPGHVYVTHVSTVKLWPLLGSHVGSTKPGRGGWPPYLDETQKPQDTGGYEQRRTTHPAHEEYGLP